MTGYFFGNIDSGVNADVINDKPRKNKLKKNTNKKYNDLKREDNSALLANIKAIDIYKESKIKNSKITKNSTNRTANTNISEVKNGDINESEVIDNDKVNKNSESDKKESSSGSIWKKVGIAAAAAVGTAAVGTGLYFGINALLNKNKNTDENDNKDDNTEKTARDKETESKGSEKSKFISINIDNYGIVRKKTESNSLRSSFEAIDAKLSEIIDKSTIPSGEGYIENKETSKVLKDSYNYVVSNVAKTSYMFDMIINSSGGKNSEGMSHKTVLRNNLSSKINRMKEIEKQLSNPVLVNANTLQNEYEKLGEDVSAFISDYASKNDSLNGTNELKYDLYFDISAFQKESAEYIDKNKSYFPEYNISKSSIISVPIDDTLNKLDSLNSKNNDEKDKIESVKSVISTLNSGIPFSDKEKDIVESMLKGDEIKNFEEKYNISISEYIGNAKNKIDSGNKPIAMSMNESERAVDVVNAGNGIMGENFQNSANDNDSNKAESLKTEFSDEKIVVGKIVIDEKEKLKKKLMNAIESGTPLDRESIEKISMRENSDVLSNEILKDFFSKEKASVQVLDEYYKCIENNQKVSEGLIKAIMNDKYSLNRLQEENPEYYKKVQLQNRGCEIEKKLSSNNINKNEILKLISSSDFAEIVRENEHIVSKLTECIDHFNKLDAIASKKSLSVKDFKEINSSLELKKIVMNDPSYKNLYSDFVKSQNINTIVTNIVNDISSGKKLNHDELFYVMNDDLGRSFINEHDNETIKKIEELHSKIVEDYTESEEVKNNIGDESSNVENSSNEQALLTKIEEKNGEIPEIDSIVKIEEKNKEDTVTKVAKYGVLGTAVEVFIDNINKNFNQENIEYNHESPSESIYNVHENEHYETHKTASFNANKAKKE